MQISTVLIFPTQSKKTNIYVVRLRIAPKNVVVSVSCLHHIWLCLNWPSFIYHQLFTSFLSARFAAFCHILRASGSAYLNKSCQLNQLLVIFLVCLSEPGVSPSRFFFMWCIIITVLAFPADVSFPHQFFFSFSFSFLNVFITFYSLLLMC